MSTTQNPPLPPPPYLLELGDLPERVAAAGVGPRHQTLLDALRGASPLALPSPLVLTHRDGRQHLKRKVLTADGVIVAEDHRAWLAAQVAGAGGWPLRSETLRQLRGLDYRLSVCEIDSLYVVQDRGGAQENFAQIEVDVRAELLDRRLFEEARYAYTRTVRDLNDLAQEACDGPTLAPELRVPLSAPQYRLARAVDVGVFVREAAALDADRTRRQMAKRITVSENGGPPRTLTIRELTQAHEMPAPCAWRGQRLFQDWTLSSAGRAGHRLCAHWALQISDHTGANGERWMNAIPLWSHTRKIARIDKVPPSDEALLAKLVSIDRRVGVPFAWYFYMLHGNLVPDWAGQRVLRAADAGRIVLPEHDHRVLRWWAEQPYGF